MNSNIRNGLFAVAMLSAAFGAQAQSFDISKVAGQVMNSGAIPSFTQTLQKQAPQVQAPAAKKAQQAPQNQQPKSELGAAGDQVVGGLGGLANGAGDVIGGTAKAGVAAVKTVASGIGGFFSNITNKTPDFNVENYSKILDGLDTSSKTEIKRNPYENRVNGKAQTLYTETYLLKSGDVIYGLTVANGTPGKLEVLGHPGLKSEENQNGYSKIVLSNSDAHALKDKFVQGMRTDPEAKKDTAPAQPGPSWGSTNFGS